MILKLRIWPALSGSGRRMGLAHFLSSGIAAWWRAKTSRLCGRGVCDGFAQRPARWRHGIGADAFAEFHGGAGCGLVDYAAGDGVTLFVLGDVLVDAGGNQLLHAEFDLALFRGDAEDLRLDDLAGAQHVLRMIDALVGADLADVDEAFDAVGDLNERAERHDLGNGAFDLGADREFAGDVGPRVGEGLLEAERDASLFGLDAEDDRVDACRPA